MRSDAPPLRTAGYRSTGTDTSPNVSVPDQNGRALWLPRSSRSERLRPEVCFSAVAVFATAFGRFLAVDRFFAVPRLAGADRLAGAERLAGALRGLMPPSASRPRGSSR